MTNMNRRDYLLRMGAAAGALASAPKLNLFAQQEQKAKVPLSKAQSDFLKKHVVQSGTRKFDLRSTEDVKLVLNGLMGLGLNAMGQCEIGFHSRDSTKHKHKLSIIVFKKTEGTDGCEEIWRIENVPPAGPLALEVTLPELDTVKFFQPPSSNGIWHDSDFRWVPNLEGGDWYNTNLRPWQGDAYKPVLVVRSGLFYTIMKTASTFRRQTVAQTPTTENVKPIGHIAEIIGANIYLKPSGTVKLTVLQDTRTLEKATGVRYEIHFNNKCKKRGADEDCVFRPYDSDETERNDFYMHRDALNLGGAQYQLVLALPPIEPPPDPDICDKGHELTDEAPCSAAGYGGQGGFPVFP